MFAVMTEDNRSSARPEQDAQGHGPSMLSWKLDASLRDALEEERLENERIAQLVSRLLTESRAAEAMHLVLIAVVAGLFWMKVRAGRLRDLPVGGAGGARAALW